jgi:hypothetical protein
MVGYGSCSTCRFYRPVGTQDAGFATGWRYPVGRCEHPNPAPGGARAGRDDVPAWSDCPQWRRRGDGPR